MRKNVEYRRFAELAKRITAALAGHEAILDGEIVCLDANGVPQFYELLYHRGGGVCFAAFDLMWLDGEDLRPLPLIERKRRLRELIPPGLELPYVSHFDARGIDLFAEVCRRDLEGIVAKFKQRAVRPSKTVG